MRMHTALSVHRQWAGRIVVNMPRPPQGRHAAGAHRQYDWPRGVPDAGCGQQRCKVGKSGSHASGRARPPRPASLTHVQKTWLLHPGPCFICYSYASDVWILFLESPPALPAHLMPLYLDTEGAAQPWLGNDATPAFAPSSRSSWSTPHLISCAVQSLSRVRLFVTPWTAVHQASLSLTISQNLLSPCPLSWWCYPTISLHLVSYSNQSPKEALFPSPPQRTRQHVLLTQVHVAQTHRTLHNSRSGLLEAGVRSCHLLPKNVCLSSNHVVDMLVFQSQHKRVTFMWQALLKYPPHPQGLHRTALKRPFHRKWVKVKS